ENLLGSRLLPGDEPGDAAGDDGSLTRPRSGHDEQGTHVMGDRLSLGQVQAFENGVHRPDTTTSMAEPTASSSSRSSRGGLGRRWTREVHRPRAEHLYPPLYS